MKHITQSLLILMSMLTCCLSSNAYNFLYDGIAYNFREGNTVAVTHRTTYYYGLPSTNHYTGNISVPTVVKYAGENYTVTSVDDDAFEGCGELNSINLPSSITSIGKNAFKYCRKLKSINLPNAVSEIKDDAFSYCTNLSSLEFPQSLTFIGETAFNGCKRLSFLEIPNAVTSIGEKAFYDCTGLKYILNRSNLKIVKKATNNGYIGYYAIGIAKDYLDGFYFGDVELTEIVFCLENKSSVIIPRYVYIIGEQAFEGCANISLVEIPTTITKIKEKAFYNCNNLKKVINYSSLDIKKGSKEHGYVGYYADVVANSYSNGFYFGDKEQTQLVYYSGAAESVEIPSTVTSIASNAFANNHYSLVELNC